MLNMKNTLDEGIIDNILAKIFSILFSTKIKPIQSKVKALNAKLQKDHVIDNTDLSDLKNMIDDKKVMAKLHDTGMDKGLINLYSMLNK